MKILLTVLACLILAAFGALGFIYSGIYDVAALHPDNPAVAWVLRKISVQSVAARLGGIEVPPGLDRPEVIQAGGKLFRENCVVCHGGPGLQPTDVAQGLNPRPFRLFRAGRRVRMNETFWIIKNGVKMTAMPGFGETHSDAEIWALAAFVRTAPGMSPQEFADKTGVAVPAVDAKPSGG